VARGLHVLVRSGEDAMRRRVSGSGTGGGGLLLEEALQIQWSSEKTEVAGDGERRRTVADSGRTVADGDNLVNNGSGQLQTITNSVG